MHNTNENNVKEIRVGGNTNVPTLSGYIHTTLNENGRAVMVAIGPKAVNTALKAIALARQNIASTDSDIMVFPEFTNVAMDDISVDGQPLTEEGKDIVKEAFKTAVKGTTRVHVGIRLFLEQCNKLTQITTRTKNSSQNRNNKPQNKNTKPRRRLSDDEIFQKSVGFKTNKGNVDLNSNGIPRV